MPDADDKPNPPPAGRAPRDPLVRPGGIEVLARDMTATFDAGVTLRAAQARLAEVGQWLPIDGDPDAPLGSLVETDSTGPLRLGYGAWRDLLLGVQFTNGKGELITAGGRTVKNVAGYDLTKFMVGQHGVFGRVVTLTTRTYRRPEAALLVTAAAGPSNVTPLLSTPCRPHWVLSADEELLLGYLGDERTIGFYEAAIGQFVPAHLLWVKLHRQSVNDDIACRAAHWSPSVAPEPGLLRVRASVPPRRVYAVDRDVLHETAQALDPAFGVVVGWCSPGEDLDLFADSVRACGGTLSPFSGRSAAPLPDLDDSTPPAQRKMIERLKHAFDPDDRLNPLPWQRR